MIAQGDNYKKPELYARVKKVIDDYKKDKNLAYFELAYALDQSKEFIYEGVKYTDPKVFLQTRLTIKNLFDFARTFEENKAFFAWLKAIDQEQIIFRYKSLISLVEEKEQECVNNDYVNKQNKNSDKLAFFTKNSSLNKDRISIMGYNIWLEKEIYQNEHWRKKQTLVKK